MDVTAIDRPEATAAARKWTVAEVEALFELPFPELMYRAQTVHRQYHRVDVVQLSTLLSIKTGGCPEDCGYCPQSKRHAGAVASEALVPVAEVLRAARAARDQGATRFCMGAAWRGPKDRDLEPVLAMVREVKTLGLETCATLGLLRPDQARKLREAGLDYYNHNLDTAPDFYGEVISTRQYQDRLDTIEAVREVGLKVCCGGIVGMGESRRQRAALLAELANLKPYPESVPINHLVRVPGTPLAEQAPLDPFEFVRSIAVARLIMPKALVRLSAGRQELGEAVQALCFLSGANSMFQGDKLLTTGNPHISEDQALLAKLGLTAEVM
jgi:biotin synthase